MDSINAGCCKCCRCDASALLRHVAADTSLCGNSSTPGELQPEHHGGNESAPASRGDAWQRWPSTLERLSTGQLVLDGGMGTEVEKLAGPEAVSAAGWSCVQSTAFPEECKQAHAAFLAAGADVIITNTYATNRHILAAAGAEELTERANRLACRVAFDARDEWCDAHPDAPRPLIAGSVSCHAPGDEVQKMQGHMAWPSPTEEATNYREQAAILAEEGVDLIFTEMVRDKEHGMRISTALGDSTVPVFMGLVSLASRPSLCGSFSCLLNGRDGLSVSVQS
jgi:S-methylmethionine-dependent homocysteine/selenocysteine methylase